MTERIWFFMTGKSALPASESRRSCPTRFTKSWQGEVLTKRAKHRAMYLLLGQMRTKKRAGR